MKALTQAAAILAIALSAAGATWWIVGPPDHACDPATLPPGHICLQSLPKEREIVWIDARSRSDWKRNGIEGSILWNLDSAEDANAMEAEAITRIFETPFVVIYCSDKGCGTSKKIAERILELGMDAEVHVLQGGWQSLKEAGKVSQTP